MRKIIAILAIMLLSGCATTLHQPVTGFNMNAPDGKEFNSLQDIVTHGILLARPDLSYTEALAEALRMYERNKPAIDAAMQRMNSAIYLADFVAALFQLQGGRDE
jgi:hypothetical protein